VVVVGRSPWRGARRVTVADVFEHSLRVRYMEVDAQGVVFNAWYLTYFDEAMAAFLGSRGLPYAALLDAGFDVQLVHCEMDWKAGLHWQDEVLVAVSTAWLGRTSFALDFETRRNGARATCSARTVYVVVATDGSGKRDLPPQLLDALGPPAPLRADPASQP
jgi:acyl-CoA thioester hydrolase